MVNLNEIKLGNFVAYKGVIYKITTHNFRDDVDKRYKIFITTKDGHTIDITEPEFNINELKYVEITDDVLNANWIPYYSGGCFIDAGECPPEAKNEWELDNNLHITKRTGYYILFNTVKGQVFSKNIVFIHELQNYYKEVAGKELEITL